MTLDAEAREVAFELLAEFGKACALKQVAQGEYDPTTGTFAISTAVHPVNLYLDQPNSQELAGGQVVATDEVAIFPALGLSVEPRLNDLVTVDGRDRLVKMVGRVWSGAQVALWRVGLAS